LLVAVYFLAGVRSLVESIEDLSDMDINIDVLMTLAAFSSALIGSAIEGALLLVLFSISGAIEEAVTAKAKSTLSQLRKLAPTRALLIKEDGTLLERAVADVQVGQRILIRMAEMVPLDGVVVEGASSVNLVHLTGESVPVSKKVGDSVPAGARNMEGMLTLQVQLTSNDSTLTRIIHLITEAQQARPTIQRWFDRLSRSYALAIISLAATFAFTFPFLFSLPFLGGEGSIYRSLAFLIAASPCALILAVPIAYLSAIGACAKKGILVKGGVTLDAFASCNIIAFDKTGTLTTGELSCLGLEQLAHISHTPLPCRGGEAREEEALAIACALERGAVHPVARAIFAYAHGKKLPSITVEGVRVLPGEGVTAMTPTAFIGRVEYLLTALPEQRRQQLATLIAAHRDKGELLAALHLATDSNDGGEQLFLFRFSDELRPSIGKTIGALRRRGIELVMLTGDHTSTAQRVASQLGISHWKAELRPEDKLTIVAELAKEGKLAMIGDGINDAPALARATVGICMGKVGSSAAIDAADIILLHDNIELLDWLMAKARKTRSIVKENLVIAIAAIVLAAFPALAGIVPLWLAVVMHEGGTLLVGLNALRLLRR